MIQIDQTKAKAITQKQALNQLSDIDLKSVRALREYIASLPDAPKQIKDHEAAAVAARAKLK